MIAGSVLLAAGMVSAWLASDLLLVGLAHAIKERQRGSTQWQELNQRREAIFPAAQVTGGLTRATWLVSAALFLTAILKPDSSGSLTRVRVAPLVGRGHGGLGLGLRFCPKSFHRESCHSLGPRESPQSPARRAGRTRRSS